jgi:hypothetical protein
VLRAVAGNRRPEVVPADAAYDRDAVKGFLTATAARHRVDTVSELAGRTGLVPQPKRWPVGRHFSWPRGGRLLPQEYDGRDRIARSNVRLRSMMLTLNMYRRQQAELAPACAA